MKIAKGLNKAVLSLSVIYFTACDAEELKEGKQENEIIQKDGAFTDDDNSSDGRLDPGSGGGTPEPPAESPYSAYFGLWASGCYDLPSSDSIDVRFAYEFTDREWARVFYAHVAGYSCSSESTVSIEVLTGPLSFGDFDDNDALTIDFKKVSYFRIFKTASQVDEANRLVLHGYDDWQIDEPKECIDRPDSRGTVVNSGMLFTLIQINADGELLVEPEVETADERATVVNPDSIPFTKIR
ncbi:MAG: hypothetical protein HRU19_32495 [Pseudobacteriovorax sp.]|nr:hypothetical protein [Pseudobacteriovorax sp.]